METDYNEEVITYRTKKVYIAGPMTGHEDWNFPAFFEAERQLTDIGFIAINPAHNDGEELEHAIANAHKMKRSWEWYMRRDLPHVLEADIVCVLPGWEKSKGARLEVEVANALKLPIMILRDGQLIPRVTVLGLSGWARAGKDTIADHLVANYGFTKMSFATPMKDALVKLDPRIDVGDVSPISLSTAVRLSGWEALKSMSNEIRPLLQRFGTEVGREMFGENFWVDYALSQIPDGAKVVFADVRFPNEADAIRNLNGQIWRVERGGYGPANDHISEHALDDYQRFDAFFNNFGDICALYEIADALMEGWNEQR